MDLLRHTREVYQLFGKFLLVKEADVNQDFDGNHNNMEKNFRLDSLKLWKLYFENEVSDANETYTQIFDSFSDDYHQVTQSDLFQIDEAE